VQELVIDPGPFNTLADADIARQSDEQHLFLCLEVLLSLVKQLARQLGPLAILSRGFTRTRSQRGSSVFHPRGHLLLVF
jgi:hypothetical protein